MRRFKRSMRRASKKSSAFFSLVFYYLNFIQILIFNFQFRKLTQRCKLFYTVDVSYDAGFSDKLSVFTDCFRLGECLNMEFLFTPIHPKRVLLELPDDSLKYENPLEVERNSVFDFIGFNAYFNQKYQQTTSFDRDKPRLELKFDERKRRKVWLLKSLVFEVKKQIL